MPSEDNLTIIAASDEVLVHVSAARIAPREPSAGGRRRTADALSRAYRRIGSGPSLVGTDTVVLAPAAHPRPSNPWRNPRDEHEPAPLRAQPAPARTLDRRRRRRRARLLDAAARHGGPGRVLHRRWHRPRRAAVAAVADHDRRPPARRRRPRAAARARGARPRSFSRDPRGAHGDGCRDARARGIR